MNVFERPLHPDSPAAAGRLLRCRTPPARPFSALGETSLSPPPPPLAKRKPPFSPSSLAGQRFAHSVGVLYIAPLKGPYQRPVWQAHGVVRGGRIPVTRWHGDVPKPKSAACCASPGASCRLHRESLESLLINKRMEIPSLFGDLRLWSSMRYTPCGCGTCDAF